MRIGIPRERLTNETRVAATPKTVEQLKKIGIETIGELARADAGILVQVFGKQGEQMKKMPLAKTMPP